ncbi:MAG: DNA polymerase IV [Phycisphaerales bacterium]|nr:DNA polymerase IV [Phycisphaerales bacterium]
MTHRRTIAHVDLDAFFASAEQLDDPAIAGVPVLVGGSGPRSVVAAASYEARAFGCHSAMPMVEAKRCCPHAVVRPPRNARYRELSAQFMQVLHQFSPLVEALSVDEAFVDLTGTQRLLGDPAQTAGTIPIRVFEAIGLHCSVGLASSKFVAKIASDLKKPRGVVIVPFDETRAFLAPLDIARIWGVGPVAEKRFRARGYQRFSDLQCASEEQVVRDLGEGGRQAWKLAQGIDDRSLEPERASKSIGQEQTFDSDTADCERLRAVLLQQIEQVAIRLRQQEFAARTVTVKFRSGKFETSTKRTSRAIATDVTSELWSEVCAIFDRWARAGVVPIRLIGVSVSGLEPLQDSATLFAEPEAQRQRRLDSVADRVRARFGVEAIRRASGASLRSAPQ